MSTFVEEVAEHVRNFNRDLLALEGEQGDAGSEGHRGPPWGEKGT